MNLDSEQAVAVAAVREAGDLCGSVQHRLTEMSVEKEDRSPVTVADFGSQALVCSRLRSAFPDDPIIAEENADMLREADRAGVLGMVVREVKRLRGDATEADVLDWIDFGGEVAYSDRFWTLDPIDGTKGFLRGDQYAIALALIENGRVVVAAVCCPNLEIPQTNQRPGVVLSAQAGQGTLIYSLDDMALVGRARVSDRGDPAMIRMCESVEAKHTSHSAAGRISEILGIRADPVRLDSQAKYAVVASGNADVYLRLPSGRRYVENIWDHAGGALLVEEAGGVVSDVSGRPLDFSRGYKLSENRGIVVSNGHVHDRLLQAVSEAGVS